MLAGILTLYLVVTGWAAVRHKTVRAGRLEMVGLAVALTTAALGVRWAIQASATMQNAVAAAAAAVVATPDSDNIARLVQTFRVLSGDGTSEATIRLKPEQLGAVTISIRVDHGAVLRQPRDGHQRLDVAGERRAHQAQCKCCGDDKSSICGRYGES